ncbi:DUF420 domain-containing protein [Putridiphycobacter roseus]|uniref:DUF420 domain-containing protein n=1 Tax=Putridiphycobacter roseus TaxID=2219161 RepID=A0A2W1N233_9FLAO|nr:DUF420 domain-containing protein [Putridiphycobacter roseus]PZE17011.1 DUF420 domain-containing protein [Putridiphycobacter roseus]
MIQKKPYRPEIEKKFKPIAIIVSIIVPIVVALLFTVKIDGVDLSFLPSVYAAINAGVALFLILAVRAIKKGDSVNHERFIKTAVIGSLLFLVGYIAYHITSSTTYYGDINKDGILNDLERNNLGASASIYYFILFTHIILSIVVIPFVCFTYLRGWAGNYAKHKKIARYTFPLWLYVAVSGVVVYLMISPFYS